MTWKGRMELSSDSLEYSGEPVTFRQAAEDGDASQTAAICLG
jgi:hypothetical protein